MKSWERKFDYEILFKDSPVYFSVKNARIILAVNDWVVFHVFDGDKYKEQQLYPTSNIHRIKQLDQ